MSRDCGYIDDVVPCPVQITGGDKGTIQTSALKSSIQRFVITEKAPTRAFAWLKAATTAFTFKTLLRHYAKRAAIRHYANQTAYPL